MSYIERRIFVLYNYGIPYTLNGAPVNQPILPTLPEPPACPNGTVYTVRPGDTMFRIANQYNISLQQLLQANPQVMNPNIIYVGQRLCVPAKITPPPPVPEPFCPNGTIYIVQRGDSLFSIARRSGVTLQQLIQANPQIPDPNVVEVGSRICIPVADKPLPTGVCQINLAPMIPKVLGATAFIDYNESILWIATFGLPAPMEFDDNFCVYTVWLVNRSNNTYLSTELKACVSGIEAGYCKFTTTLEGYDEIIVTPESIPVPSKPCGPIVLKGNTNQCL